MSEPSCHFHHKDFSPSQKCLDCGYKEKSLEELKNGVTKVYVLMDPLYEKAVSVHKSYGGAYIRCVQLDESEGRNIKGDTHEIYDFELED